MKSIKITEHANERVRKRKIPEGVIEKLIRSPQQIVPDAENANRRIFQSLFTDSTQQARLLRAVVEETESEFIIVTAYATSQINRYWRK